MNRVVLMGRLTKDPEVRYSQREKSTAVARYTLAVTRSYKRDGEPDADFINCVAFGRIAELAEKYLKRAAGLLLKEESKREVIRTRTDGKSTRQM